MSWYADTEGDTVPVTSIDALNLTACHFIKIDAEYMEYQVLRGAAHTIARFHPYLFVENESLLRGEYEAHDRLLLALDTLGYLCHWLHTPLYSTRNYFRNPVLVWNAPVGVYSHNMVCYHGSRALTTQLERVMLSERTSLGHADVLADFSL